MNVLAQYEVCASFFCFLKGHSSNLHHLMPANIQIIRGQIGTPTVSPQTFTSHLPRGKMFS